MLKTLKNLVLITAVIFTVGTMSGCVALFVGAAAGAGGVAYTQGLLEKNFDEPVKRLHKASLSALKNLDIFVVTDELNRHNAKIKGEDSDGESVRVDIEALTEKSSKLKIRVGVFGNETKSYMILTAVEKKL